MKTRLLIIIPLALIGIFTVHESFADETIEQSDNEISIKDILSENDVERIVTKLQNYVTRWIYKFKDLGKMKQWSKHFNWKLNKNSKKGGKSRIF